MATKKQPGKKTASATPKVTRIKAADSAAKTKSSKPVTAAKKPATKKAKPETKKALPDGEPAAPKNPLKAAGGYLAGAWSELKQVRWPNRQETWGLTVAVILFTAFFLGLIVLLDYIFSLLFKLII